MGALSLVVFSLILWFFLEQDAFTTKEPASDSQTVSDSIAVLPFMNMTGDPDNEMFALGISEEILNSLARSSSMKVAARTSAFGFRDTNKSIPEIAELLDVATVLEGSVRQDGDQLRITTQLIDGSTGAHIWSDTFDYEVERLFEIQEDIAHNVLSRLQPIKPILEISRPVNNPIAYQHYVIGRTIQNKRLPGYQEESTRHFDAAIDLEPDFSAAYARRAISLLLSNSRGTKGLERAKGDIDSALAIDENNADALAAAALFFSNVFDFSQTEKYARRALEKNPQLIQAYIWLAKALTSRGAVQEALDVKLAGLELDPFNPILRGNMGIHYLVRGDYDNARQQLGVVLDRVDFGYSPLLAMISLDNSFGNFDQALEWVKVGQKKFGYLDYYRLESAYQHCNIGMKDRCDELLADYPTENINNSFWLSQYLNRLLVLNRIDELENALNAEIRNNRKDFPTADWMALLEADFAFQGKDYTNAVIHYRALAAMDANVNRERFGSSTEIAILSRLAFALKQTDRSREAEKILAAADRLASSELEAGMLGAPVQVAIVAHLRWMQGRQEEAMDLMEQAFAKGWRHIYTLDWDRSWDDIRQTERYKTLEARVEEDLAQQRQRLTTQ